MRNRLLRSVALIPIALTMAAVAGLSGSEQRDALPSDRDRFVGGWRLVWLEYSDADGKTRRADCTGLFVFTQDGHASVQVMYRNAGTAASEAPVQYTQGGYEATFGRYDVDQKTQTFTFHVEGAIARDLVGKDLTRVYEFSGNQLIVNNTGAHRRIAWERF